MIKIKSNLFNTCSSKISTEVSGLSDTPAFFLHDLIISTDCDKLFVASG